MIEIGIWVVGTASMISVILLIGVLWEVGKIRSDQIFVLGMLTRVLRNVDPMWQKPLDDRNSEVRYMRLETREGIVTKTVERDGV